jgi:hypothetical protein
MSDWRAELGTFLTDHNRKSRAEKDAARFKEFLSVTALPALQEIGNELKKYGRMATIRQTEAAAALSVTMGDEDEITFYVLYRTMTDATILPCAEAHYRTRRGQGPTKANVFFRDPATPYSLEDVTKEEIIQGFLKVYRLTFED